MDRHFLEFWGNFLIDAAKQQKQLEDMAQWMHQGFKGFEELTAMFNKFYGLDHLEKDTPSYMETWKRSTENFLHSFNDVMGLMGMATASEHTALVKKYEKLKEKAAAQEQTINRLQLLLKGKATESQAELVQGFQDLIEKQSKQFQEAMASFGSFFKKENTT